MCSRRLRPFLLLDLASLLVPLGFSQADYSTATLKGTVLDPQRLFISGAQVTIRNPSTGFAKTVATGMHGERPLGAGQLKRATGTGKTFVH